MDDVIGWLAIAGLCIGIPAAAVGLFYVFIFGPQRRRQKRHEKAGSAWAKQHGWQYALTEHSLVKRWQGEPFNGHGGAEDVLSGTHRGRSVVMFTYGYAEAGVVMNSENYFNIVAVFLGSQRPWFQLVPRESPRSEQFFDVFDVRSENNQFSNALLQSGLGDWLLRDPRARQHSIRFEGGELLAWGSEGLVEDEGLATADYLVDLVEQIPPQLLR